MRQFGFNIKAFPCLGWWFLLLVSALFSCQDEGLLEQYIRVKMLGVFEEPVELDNSEGNWFEPISQTYTLENVLIFSSLQDGDQIHELYGKEEAGTYRITNRSQRIYRKKIDSELVGQEISRFVLVFANSLAGASKFKGDHELSLANIASCQPSLEVAAYLGDTSEFCVLEYATPFVMTQGQNYNFIVQVHWKKTVLRDESGDTPLETMYAPSFVVSMEKD